MKILIAVTSLLFLLSAQAQITIPSYSIEPYEFEMMDDLRSERCFDCITDILVVQEWHLGALGNITQRILNDARSQSFHSYPASELWFQTVSSSNTIIYEIHYTNGVPTGTNFASGSLTMTANLQEVAQFDDKHDLTYGTFHSRHGTGKTRFRLLSGSTNQPFEATLSVHVEQIPSMEVEGDQDLTFSGDYEVQPWVHTIFVGTSQVNEDHKVKVRVMGSGSVDVTPSVDFQAAEYWYRYTVSFLDLTVADSVIPSNATTNVNTGNLNVATNAAIHNLTVDGTTTITKFNASSSDNTNYVGEIYNGGGTGRGLRIKSGNGTGAGIIFQGATASGTTKIIVYDNGFAQITGGLEVDAAMTGTSASFTGDISTSAGGISATAGTISAPFAVVGTVLYLGNTSGPSMTQGSGAPTANLQNGSVYFRTGGTGPNFYVRQNGAWVAK